MNPKFIEVKGISNDQTTLINAPYLYVISNEKDVPYQGWKIHVSATLDNYQNILNMTHEVCIQEKVNYKYIYTEESLFSILSKNAHPTTVGKFITIYPYTNNQFLNILEKMNDNLENEQGVYILTDKPFKKSNILFYRYGVMNPGRYDSKEKPLLRFNHQTFPDIKGAFYEVPEFVEEIFPDLDSDRHDGDVLLNSRYKMSSILHQSGSGNIYSGTDIFTGDAVIIKEARNNVYITKEMFAVDLLKNEAKMLAMMKELDFVPQLIETFYFEQNFYLVESQIEGTTLNSLRAKYNMLLPKSKKERANYNFMVQKLISDSFKNLKRIHELGIMLEDISLENILIDSKDNVYFIDFETAYKKEDGIFLSTSSSYFPNKIQAVYEKRDEVKLWYCIIHLISDACQLLTFDLTGAFSLQVFLKEALECKLPQDIVYFLSQDLGIERIKQKPSFIFSKLVNLGMTIEKIVTLREELLSTLLSEYKIKTDGHTLMEEFINSKSIEEMGFFVQNQIEIHSKMTPIQEKKNPSIDDILALIVANKIDPKLGFQKIFTRYNLKKMPYIQKIAILRCFNSQKMSNHDSIRNIIDSILEENIQFKEQIPYVFLDGFYNPHYYSGNAGLIIELIQYSQNTDTTFYDDWIKKLGEGINHFYAKSTNLYFGIAGLGLGNLYLYTYFKESDYLSRSIKIAKHLNDYSFTQRGYTKITDPESEFLNYGYSRGMLGQYYFINKLVKIMKSEGVRCINI